MNDDLTRFAAARLAAAPDRHGTRLEVRFARSGDRHAHTLWRVAADGDDTLLATSLEGAAEQPWPPSPALQQLSVHQLPDRRTAILLVGMAGTSHFSLSITQDDTPTALVFDAAVRVSQPPDGLGSAYRLAAPGGPLSIEPLDAAIRGVDHDATRIAPQFARGGQRTTIRWRYRVALDDRAG